MTKEMRLARVKKVNRKTINDEGHNGKGQVPPWKAVT